MGSRHLRPAAPGGSGLRIVRARRCCPSGRGVVRPAETLGPAARLAWNACMNDVWLARDLMDRGVAPSRLSALRRSGRLTSVRRGALTLPGQRSAVENHRLCIEGTWPQIHPGGAISHWSAAVLHDLWLLHPRLDEVWVTRPGHIGGKIRSAVHMVHCPLGEGELTEVDGIVCTSPARTVIDVARHDGFLPGLVMADDFLRRGGHAAELWAVVRAGSRRPGNATARRVVACADGRSESPQESHLRGLMEQFCLPRPTPQLVINDQSGRFVARVDLALEESRLAIEYDGEGKYMASDGPSQLLEVLAREKAREQTIVDAGWWPLRVRKADMVRPQELMRRIRLTSDERRRQLSRNSAA